MCFFKKRNTQLKPWSTIFNFLKIQLSECLLWLSILSDIISLRMFPRLLFENPSPCRHRPVGLQGPAPSRNRSGALSDPTGHLAYAPQAPTCSPIQQSSSLSCATFPWSSVGENHSSEPTPSIIRWGDRSSQSGKPRTVKLPAGLRSPDVQARAVGASISYCCCNTSPHTWLPKNTTRLLSWNSEGQKLDTDLTRPFLPEGCRAKCFLAFSCF